MSQCHVNAEVRTVASWDCLSPSPDVPHDTILCLHYFADSNTSCLVLEGGDIVTVQHGDSDSLSSGVGAHVEVVGTIEEGISAARWAPDESLLTITTKVDTVVFMSRAFDGVADATMSPDDLKLSKHVSVGWGKKETQFKGKGAKALRDPTIPERVDEGRYSPQEDYSTTISWRGDSAYVAVSTALSGQRRVVRVYSREGVLDSVSEPVDGLEAALSWRPAGNLIACVQRLDNRAEVVFFERNGLRHGQFTLRSPDSSVDLTNDKIRLEWNCDSTVLAVILSGLVQLWTMKNYHWYLKQELPRDAGRLHFVWHPEEALRFALSSEGRYEPTAL